MTVSLTVSLPHVSNDPFPDDVRTAEPTNCLPRRQAALSRDPVPPEMHVLPTLPLQRASHGVQRIRCLRPQRTCHTTSRQQHHSPARPAQSASAMAESTRRPFGKSSSFMSRVVDRNRMRRFKAMRSETVGAEACLASCPTVYCRSGRNTDKNNKRPTWCSEARVLFFLQRGLVYDSILHTSSSTLPRRACQPRVLHDILDQLLVDHQPESVHRSFQHPTRSLSRVFRQLSLTLVWGPPHIAVYTGISRALDQSIALFLESRCVVAPGGGPAFQTLQGLEQLPSPSRFHFRFRWRLLAHLRDLCCGGDHVAVVHVHTPQSLWQGLRATLQFVDQVISVWLALLASSPMGRVVSRMPRRWKKTMRPLGQASMCPPHPFVVVSRLFRTSGLSDVLVASSTVSDLAFESADLGGGSRLALGIAGSGAFQKIHSSLQQQPLVACLSPLPQSSTASTACLVRKTPALLPTMCSAVCRTCSKWARAIPLTCCTVRSAAPLDSCEPFGET